MIDEKLRLKQVTMSSRATEMNDKLLEHKDGLAKSIKKELSDARIVNRITNFTGDRCKSFSKQGC